jgi:hypothetical protein
VRYFLNKLAYLLILDGHGSIDFTIGNKTSTCIWLKYGHTPKPYFTPLQPLNVSYFKTFKITFKKKRNNAIQLKIDTYN